MKNLKEFKESRKMEREIKNYKEKKDYNGLFLLTLKIISKRKNLFRKKIENYIREYKKYINKKGILSGKELNDIWFYFKKMDILSREYDKCSELEERLEEKDIYEIVDEIEKQYKMYANEINATY